MAERQTYSGYVAASNDWGLELQGIPGPHNGFWNYSKPQYRDVPWDNVGKGDYVTIGVTTSGYIKTISHGGATPAPAPQTAQPPQAQARHPQPAAAPSQPGPTPEWPPDPTAEPLGPEHWPTERPAPPPPPVFVDRDIHIGRQVALKVAGELYPILPESVRATTVEQLAVELAQLTRTLYQVIEE
jgi:hypothetical protein